MFECIQGEYRGVLANWKFLNICMCKYCSFLSSSKTGKEVLQSESSFHQILLLLSQDAILNIIYAHTMSLKNIQIIKFM